MRGRVTRPGVKFHRNGVGGVSFFSVPFMFGEGAALLGIVFPESGTVAVVCPEHPEYRYRGDVFEEWLREVCRAAEDVDATYEYEQAR